MTVLLLAIATCLTACGSLHSPSQPRAKGTAFNDEKPSARVHVLCTTPGQLSSLLSTADDPALGFRGPHTFANGSLAIGCKDSHDRWLRGYECGGRSFIAGTEADACTLEVSNTTDLPLDLAITQDGKPLAHGEQRLAAHATERLPLRWSTIASPAALYHYDLGAQRGAIEITAYNVPGAKPRLNERLAPLPTGGPQRRYAPLAVPFEY